MSNFRRVWIVGGIIFGLGMIMLDILTYDQQNWLAAIFTGIITGILSGLCLGFVAHHLFRAIKISWVRHIVTALLLTATGLLLGIGSFFILDRIPHGQWEQVTPPPPEKAVSFLEHSKFNFFGGTIYIESENGNIFSYKCPSENPCNWIKENSVPSEPEDNYDVCSPERQLSYIPPMLLFKKVADSARADVCGPDYDIQVNLIILNDGTVWMWEKYFSVYMLVFILPVWLILSLIAGFASYLALLGQKNKVVIQDESNL
jgi:hypothetical protein